MASEEDRISAVLEQLLADADFDTITERSLRASVAKELGIDIEGNQKHKQLIHVIICLFCNFYFRNLKRCRLHSNIKPLTLPAKLRCCMQERILKALEEQEDEAEDEDEDFQVINH